MTSVGVIVIGRNEGERLRACLRSVRAAAAGRQNVMRVVDTVYVDSHSSDDSVAIARAEGAMVLELDPEMPFTAARARNAGAASLLARHPQVELLQFLDGDTELNRRWLAHGTEYLRHHRRVGVVCGRRRERFPDATIYNLMADMEWDTPVGFATEFGGDCLMRAPVFLRVGGFDPGFIAGEEPDFAARLRKLGIAQGMLLASLIVRLSHEMTVHDLAMTRFSQWWRRTQRSGHALAQLAHAHGGRPLYFYNQQRRSTIFWTLLFPLGLSAVSLWLSMWLWFLLPAGYVVLAGRILRFRLRRGDDERSAAIYAAFTVLGKFPQLLGMLKFLVNRYRGRSSRVIEYKRPTTLQQNGNPPAAAIGNA